jgi:hypothetical protein
LDWGFVVVVPFAFWSRLFLNFHLICWACFLITLNKKV